MGKNILFKRLFLAVVAISVLLPSFTYAGVGPKPRSKKGGKAVKERGVSTTVKTKKKPTTSSTTRQRASTSTVRKNTPVLSTAYEGWVMEGMPYPTYSNTTWSLYTSVATLHTKVAEQAEAAERAEIVTAETGATPAQPKPLKIPQTQAEQEVLAEELLGLDGETFAKRVKEAIELYGKKEVEANRDIYLDMVSLVQKTGHWIGMYHGTNGLTFTYVKTRINSYVEDPYMQALAELRSRVPSYMEFSTAQTNKKYYEEVDEFVKKNNRWPKSWGSSAEPSLYNACKMRMEKYPNDPSVQQMLLLYKQTTGKEFKTDRPVLPRVAQQNKKYYEQVKDFVDKNKHWPRSNRPSEQPLYISCYNRMKKYPNDPFVQKMLLLYKQATGKDFKKVEATNPVNEPVVEEAPVSSAVEPATTEAPVASAVETPVATETPVVETPVVTENPVVTQTPAVHQPVAVEIPPVPAVEPQQDVWAWELLDISEAEFQQKLQAAMEEYGEDVLDANWDLYFRVWEFVNINGHWMSPNMANFGADIYRDVKAGQQQYANDPYIQAISKLQRRTMSFDVAQINKTVYQRLVRFVQQNNRWPEENATEQFEQSLYNLYADRVEHFPQDPYIKAMIQLKNNLEANR